ncbi:MAG TPA: anthranilate phosphoribosyltransferase, partial [Cytophagales bacterium]|nr:anthranilate phosphoribosyltransferase [Cytophagales bacterium]
MVNATTLLDALIAKTSLSQTEAYSLFNSIMHGEQSESMIAAVLTALKM